MKTASEIRLSNFKLLLAEAGSAANLARLTKVPAPLVSQIKNGVINPSSGKPRTIGDDTARKLERGMGKKEGWLDADHSAMMFGALNAMEAQLITLFRALTDDDRDDILREANNVFSARFKGVASPSNPWANAPAPGQKPTLPPLPKQLEAHHPAGPPSSKKKGNK